MYKVEYNFTSKIHGGNQNPYIEGPHNVQKNKYKRRNNELLKHTHKTKDRETRTPLKTGGKPKHVF
jgi:hypothetical protein